MCVHIQPTCVIARLRHFCPGALRLSCRASKFDCCAQLRKKLILGWWWNRDSGGGALVHVANSLIHAIHITTHHSIQSHSVQTTIYSRDTGWQVHIKHYGYTVCDHCSRIPSPGPPLAQPSQPRYIFMAASADIMSANSTNPTCLRRRGYHQQSGVQAQGASGLERSVEGVLS